MVSEIIKMLHSAQFRRQLKVGDRNFVQISPLKFSAKALLGGIFENVLEVRRKHRHIFYISILLYLISACLNEHVMGKKLDICAEPRLKIANLHNIWSWRQRQSRCQTEK